MKNKYNNKKKKDLDIYEEVYPDPVSSTIIIINNYI